MFRPMSNCRTFRISIFTEVVWYIGNDIVHISEIIFRQVVTPGRVIVCRYTIYRVVHKK